MKEYANGTSVGGRRLNKTVEQKMEEVLTATLTFEEFALRFGQYHLVNNTAHLSVNSQNIGKYRSFPPDITEAMMVYKTMK